MMYAYISDRLAPSYSAEGPKPPSVLMLMAREMLRRLAMTPSGAMSASVISGHGGCHLRCPPYPRKLPAVAFKCGWQVVYGSTFF